jgi:hypothetical protein
MNTCFKITVDEGDSEAASAALFDKFCEQDVPAARRLLGWEVVHGSLSAAVCKPLIR